MHTKLRRSLPCCHNMMPVSWKGSACYLDLALNPDSVLDVAEMMDFGWFFYLQVYLDVPDQGKTLRGYQYDTAEVPGKFSTKAENFLTEKLYSSSPSVFPYTATSMPELW